MASVALTAVTVAVNSVIPHIPLPPESVNTRREVTVSPFTFHKPGGTVSGPQKFVLRE